MRILIISHEADVTGAPISALQQAEAMAGLGHDVRIVLRRDGPLTPRFSAIAPTDIWPHAGGFSLSDALDQSLRHGPFMALKCLRNPDRPYCLSRSNRLAAQMLAQDLRAWGPDAIYANTTHCGDVIDELDLPTPIFTHVREMAPTIAALDPRRQRSALEKSKFFFCASQFVADDLAENFNIAKERMKVEPPAVSISSTDVQNTDKEKDAIEKEFGITPEDRLLVGAGTLMPRKGPELFVKAAHIALESYDGPGRLVFIWLGDGDLLPALRAQVNVLGRDRDILFPGIVTAPLPYFRRAAAMLVSSIEDPYPRVAIEAAAMGTPVIAFDKGGGAADLVRNYDAGDLISEFDANAMGAAAAQRAANWTGPDAALSARALAGHVVGESARRIVSQIENHLHG